LSIIRYPLSINSPLGKGCIFVALSKYSRNAFLWVVGEMLYICGVKVNKMAISIIAAVAQNGAIGKDNKLLWHIPEDLRRFKQLTSGHAVIMGRKTFDSIGKPLPNRQNIVITKTTQSFDIKEVTFVSSLREALQQAQGDEVFIIGGESIYRAAMPLAQRLYITQVYAEPEADTFFPTIDSDWQLIDSEEVNVCEKSGLRYSFLTYERKT
jgi:dihydrofolate reductase